MENFLFICTGHQSTQDKIKHVESLLSTLKNQGGSVCYTTHVSDGLSKISELCDYIVYDRDDYFPDEEQLLEALPDIPDCLLDPSQYLFYNFGSFELRWKWVRSHSKPALANFKNGLDVAKSHGFEWIVYLEYDTILPPINVVDYFDNKIKELVLQGMDGHFYLLPGTPCVWPFFFVCRTDIFVKDENFYSAWQTSNIEYFKKIGLLPIEELLLRIASKSKVVFESLESVNKNMGYQINKTSDVSIFNANDEPEKKKYFGKNDPFDFCVIDMIPTIKNGVVGSLELWVILGSPIPDSPRLIIDVYRDGENIIHFDGFNTSQPAGSWTCFHILSDVEYCKEKSSLIKLQSVFETSQGTFTKSITLNMRDIEKYSMCKSKIIFNGN